MPRGTRIPFNLDGAVIWSEDEAGSHVVVQTPEGVLVRAPLGERGADEVTLQFQGLPWAITVTVADVNGVWQIVGLNIHGIGIVRDETGDRPRLTYDGPKDAEPTITKDLLQQIPLRQLLDAAVSAQAGSDDFMDPFELERPPTGWGDDHYRAVAEVYRNAPGAPLKAISARWNVSRAAASKWVKEARVRGILGYPTRPGVAGASEAVSPIKKRRERGAPKGGRR